MIERGRWYLATARVPSAPGTWFDAGRRRVCVAKDGAVYVTHTSGDARHPPGEMQLREITDKGFVAAGVVERGRGRNRREHLVVAEFTGLVPE
jgi:hypothetical protein